MKPRRQGPAGNRDNIIVISDTHCGCKLGLHPSGPVILDEGTPSNPSRLQRKLWSIWREFWDEWVPRVTRGEPYDLVVNGDALDGVHHGSVTQISHNMNDQHAIAMACLEPEAKKCLASGGRYYHVRGTEAHVGKSGVYEERLAKELGAVPNEDEQYARWELWLRVGPGKGHLCHFLHHIGTTGSAAYETSALTAEQVASFTESGKHGDNAPQVIVRSHRHRHFETRSSGKEGYYIVTVTPGWQLKTPFAYRIPGARLSQPQFGGILIRAGDEELHSRFFVRRLERPREG